MAKFIFNRVDKIGYSWNVEATSLAEAKVKLKNGFCDDPVDETIEDTEDLYWSDEHGNVLEDE